MANLNRIVLIGRLTADPESRATVEGLPLTRFRLAVTRPFGQGEDNVDYIDVVTWRRLAEVCASYLKKGRLVLVEGRIQNRSFEDQLGQKKWVTEVIARNMTMLDQGGAAQPASKSEPVSVSDDSELDSDLPF